jgi:hypothetical protein
MRRQNTDLKGSCILTFTGITDPGAFGEADFLAIVLE